MTNNSHLGNSQVSDPTLPDVKDKPTKMLSMRKGRVEDIFRAIEEMTPLDQKTPVTVGTAIYNTRPEYLSLMLHSIRRQNYPAIERVLLIDDGSDDPATVEYLRNVEKQIDHAGDGPMSKFEVHRRPHKGAGAAYNYLMQTSKTDFTALIGSDDAWNYEFVTTIMSCINPEIMAMGTFCVVTDENMRPLKKWPVMGAPIYNADIFRKHDIWFREDIRKWIDEDHYQRLNKKLGVVVDDENKTVFRVIRDFLYYYRFHGKNITERVRELEKMKVDMKAVESARKMATVSMEYEGHARRFAEIMKATYVPMEGEIMDYNAIYMIGFGNPGLAKMFPQLKSSGKTIILHWMPQDIERLDYDPKIRKIVATDVDRNLAQNTAVKKELETRGITADVLNLDLLLNKDQCFIFRQRFYYLCFGVKQTVAVE